MMQIELSNLWSPKTFSLSNSDFNLDLMGFSKVCVQTTHPLWSHENIDNRRSLLFANMNGVTKKATHYNHELFQIALHSREKIKTKPVSIAQLS